MMEKGTLTGQTSGYLCPELLVEGTGDEASLEQHHHAFRSPVLDLEVQVLFPVAQLGLLQGFDVEIRPLDLRNTK